MCFSVSFAKILRTLFYRTYPVAASVKQKWFGNNHWDGIFFSFKPLLLSPNITKKSLFLQYLKKCYQGFVEGFKIFMGTVRTPKRILNTIVCRRFETPPFDKQLLSPIWPPFPPFYLFSHIF